ncbi:Transglycosylase [Gossypium australe]|uniref:Transglycosylase n=1 Tax=Gossypium australe TaxID=47621 RepID=A0A5B6VDM9_9ROSI|nr:Transglycosylase [Gossypium australe]
MEGGCANKIGHVKSTEYYLLSMNPVLRSGENHALNEYQVEGKEQEMICAIAELESNRRPLATGYDKKTNLITIGIMQVSPKVAEWIVREEDYLLFPVEEDPDILYRPFVNVYFGAAYLRWLSNFDGKIRTEEFVVRAYSGGTKKVNHKSTLPYWKRYLQVKECYLSSISCFASEEHINVIPVEAMLAFEAYFRQSK